MKDRDFEDLMEIRTEHLRAQDPEEFGPDTPDYQDEEDYAEEEFAEGRFLTE